MTRQEFALRAAEIIKRALPDAEVLRTAVGDDGQTVYIAFKVPVDVHMSACLPMAQGSKIVDDTISASDLLFVNMEHGPDNPEEDQHWSIEVIDSEWFFEERSRAVYGDLIMAALLPAFRALEDSQ